jgi:hypothetical protein
MYLKRYFLAALVIASALFTGCSAKEQILYGEYADITIRQNAAYQKSYLMMDCCDEWDDFVKFAKRIKGAGSVEGFELYLYDKHENVINPKDTMDVIYHPTDDFKKREGEIAVCAFPSGTLYPIEVLENGDIAFSTDKDGIFIAVKYSEHKLWISNENCEGQCRTCSDEW